MISLVLRTAASATLALIAVSAWAADYPQPREADWIARDFRFHTGDMMSELRLHYTTVGEPTGVPVLILHVPRALRAMASNCEQWSIAQVMPMGWAHLRCRRWLAIVVDGS
jgi:hypothetical protein